MHRIYIPERQNWQQHVESNLGFMFHTINGEKYWTEDAYYTFTLDEIERIETATEDVHNMCMQIVADTIKRGDYHLFGINDVMAQIVEYSWKHQKSDNLYGRFDFTITPDGTPKMLEYNADTPTALYEASVVQWDWLQNVFPHADQFNSIHEKLIDRWGSMFKTVTKPTVHFACVEDSMEDYGTVEYLRDTAIQAGLRTTSPLYMSEIGYDHSHGVFVDNNDSRIDTIFKLYPWEWMMNEDFIHYIIGSRIRMIEPGWKILLSNKTILPLLWERFEGHHNLLPASFEPMSNCVRKPIFSREGANIDIFSNRGVVSGIDLGYGAEGHVYQQYQELPNFNGNYAVIGSWMIGDVAAGIGIREDDGPITKNTSRFVPHLFLG